MLLVMGVRLIIGRRRLWRWRGRGWEGKAAVLIAASWVTDVDGGLLAGEDRGVGSRVGREMGSRRLRCKLGRKRTRRQMLAFACPIHSGTMSVGSLAAQAPPPS